ncbi:hypothetical protein PYCC9005_004218 [Savitreella phatthalungensis]
MAQRKTVCVFCGSATGSRPSYMAAATELAHELAVRRWKLVYGGGSSGLMGAVASAAIQAGLDPETDVTGIIPSALVKRERNAAETLPGTRNEEGLDIRPAADKQYRFDPQLFGRTLVVDSMHTRKRMMSDLADCFVVLPGGYGTLDELFEIVTWNQLGIHARPVVLYDVDGFYKPLLEFLDKAVEAGFIGRSQRNIIVSADTAEQVCNAVLAYRPVEGRLNLDWSAIAANSSRDTSSLGL